MNYYFIGTIVVLIVIIFGIIFGKFKENKICKFEFDYAKLNIYIDAITRRKTELQKALTLTKKEKEELQQITRDITTLKFKLKLDESTELRKETIAKIQHVILNTKFMDKEYNVLKDWIKQLLRLNENIKALETTLYS